MVKSSNTAFIGSNSARLTCRPRTLAGPRPHKNDPTRHHGVVVPHRTVQPMAPGRTGSSKGSDCRFNLLRSAGGFRDGRPRAVPVRRSIFPVGSSGAAPVPSWNCVRRSGVVWARPGTVARPVYPSQTKRARRRVTPGIMYRRSSLPLSSLGRSSDMVFLRAARFDGSRCSGSSNRHLCSRGVHSPAKCADHNVCGGDDGCPVDRLPRPALHTPHCCCPGSITFSWPFQSVRPSRCSG